MKAFLILLVIISLPISILHGQMKYEREYRLDINQVPPQALKFVDALNFTNKVKWYKEEGFYKNSIEAKTRYQSQKYSIEFDTSGMIEDIEIEINWEEVPLDIRNAIDKYLDSNFQRSKICKVQSQFVGDVEYLLKITSAKTRHSNDYLTVCYELEVEVKRKDKYQKLELLFDEGGKLLKESTIIFKNTDHLEY